MSDLHRKQRLAYLIATDFGGRQDSFVQRSGRGKGRVSQMLGAEHPFGEKAARLLAEDVGLHPDWFNNSWPTPNEVAQGARIDSNVISAKLGGFRIPVINYVQAGLWSGVIDGSQHGDADDWLMTDQQLSRSAFAVEIKGDSMLPEFKPGDRVIIDPDVSPLPGDFVIAKNGEDEATFKKYRPRGADANGQAIFELIPLNEDFASMRSDVVPVRIVGTMVEHRKYRRPR